MWRRMIPSLRHVVALGIIMPGVFFVAVFNARHSDPHEAAEEFVSSDDRIRELVGQVTHVNFRFWDGFHATEWANGGNANYFFGVDGKLKKSVVKVRLIGRQGRWSVVAASIRFPNGAILPIVGKIGDAETSESERGGTLTTFESANWDTPREFWIRGRLGA